MSHDWTRDVDWDFAASLDEQVAQIHPVCGKSYLLCKCTDRAVYRYEMSAAGVTPDGERSRRKWKARAARADREWLHVGPNPEALRKFATRCVRPGCGHLSTEHVVRHVSDHCKACHCPGYVKGSIFGSHFR